MNDSAELTILHNDETITLRVPVGSNLRRVLLDSGLTPYAWATRQLNCGGRGLCATCGVDVRSAPPTAMHWHDQLAARFRYPRLSCQITLAAPLTVRIMTEKWVWGRRQPAADAPPRAD